MRNQKGFTLIELIIVIVVLGILAVTAAPQFIDFSTDARTSSVKGLKGAIQGATQTTYGRAAIDGKLAENDGATPNPGPLTLDNGVELKYGYPLASTDGILKAAKIDSSDWTIYENGDVIPDSGTAPSAGTIVISEAGVNNGGTDFSDPTTASGCFVAYTDAAGANIPPVITVKTDGCGN